MFIWTSRGVAAHSSNSTGFVIISVAIGLRPTSVMCRVVRADRKPVFSLFVDRDDKYCWSECHTCISDVTKQRLRILYISFSQSVPRSAGEGDNGVVSMSVLRAMKMTWWHRYHMYQSLSPMIVNVSFGVERSDMIRYHYRDSVMVF